MAMKSPVQGNKRTAPSTTAKRAASTRKASSTMKGLQSSGLGDTPIAQLTAMDQKKSMARRKAYDKKKATKANPKIASKAKALSAKGGTASLVAANIAKSAAERKAAGAGFKKLSKKASKVTAPPEPKGIVSMGVTKSGKAKLNYQSIGGAAKPKSAKSAAPQKTKAPKASGTGKRTRSFSESKIKRDKNGKFARK